MTSVKLLGGPWDGREVSVSLAPGRSIPQTIAMPPSGACQCPPEGCVCSLRNVEYRLATVMDKDGIFHRAYVHERVAQTPEAALWITRIT